MGDMTDYTFEQYPHGKAALKKFGNVPENFRIYSAGWLGNNPRDWTVMEVCGAEFRAAKTGKNKGKLSVMMVETKRKVYVTADEIKARS